MKGWIELEHAEEHRDMKFKGSDGFITLHDVTHIMMRESSVRLKHADGVFYFQKDQVQWINSKCEDWTI